MKTTNFHHTRKAIIEYTSFIRNWETLFALIEKENAEGRMTNLDFTAKFWAMSDELKKELTKVGEAFYEDTKDYNTLDNCKLVVAGNSKDLLPKIPKWVADLAAVDVP